MELLIEAISDLKSACSVRHDALYELLPQLIWHQISWQRAVLPFQGEGWSKWISVRVWIFVIKEGGGLPVILHSGGMCQAEAFRWSQNSLLMTSAPKELYSNPGAALADYPASILQRI